MPKTSASARERELTSALKTSYMLLFLSGAVGTMLFYVLYIPVRNDLDNIGMVEGLLTIGLCGVGALIISLVGIVLSGIQFCSAFQSKRKAMQQFFSDGRDIEFATDEENEIINKFIQRWGVLCFLCKLICALPIVVIVWEVVAQSFR